MLLLQFGNMGKELAKYNTKLFAEQVMPKLQDAVLGMGGPLVAAADGRRRSAPKCRRSCRVWPRNRPVRPPDLTWSCK